MHDHVAKAGKFTPRYLRLGRLDAGGQALARLGECLQVADDSILDQPRCLEASSIARRVLADAFNALAHVGEQHSVAVGPRIHNATASASTRSRSAG